MLITFSFKMGLLLLKRLGTTDISVQLNCYGIILFMFGLVSFHLIFLILEYVACFFMNLFISTF